MSLLEIVSVVFSFISIWLAVKKSKHTWSIGLIGILGYALLFWEQKMYINYGLQFIFIGQSLYGYNQWNFGFEKAVKKINWYKLLIISLPVYFILYFFFKNQSDNPQPFLDATTSILSIVALYLMMIGKKENWLIWTFTNVLYVLMFIKQDMNLSALLYSSLIFLSLKGYFEWKNIK